MLRRQQEPVTATERFVLARDAYSCALLLSLFVLLAAVTSIGIRELPWWPFRWIWIARGGVAALALAYLALTRDRPRARVACVLSLVQVVPLLALFPLLAAKWTALGRACEVFVDLRLVLASLPLAATPSVRHGLALAVAFSVEAVAIVLWQRGTGVALDVTEPAAALVFGVTSVALLALREGRRRLAVRYLRVNADATALERSSAQLEAVAGQLRASLARMTAALERLGTATPANATVENVRHALAKLGVVREKLTALTPLAETASAPPPRDGPASSPSVAEELFQARNAQNAVMALSVIAFLAGTIAVLSSRSLTLGWAPLLWVLQSGVGLVCLLLLWRTRERPSVTRAIALFLALVLPYQLIFLYAQTQWSRLGVPYEPFWGHQAMMVVLTLATPRYLGLGVALELLFLLEAVGVYYGLHLSSIRHLVPLGEPWPTALFCAIGIAFLGIREQRRVTSVRLLRRESEVAILLRRESLYLALRDQINSPMQVLTIGVGMLEMQKATDASVKDAADALAELAAIAQKLPTMDQTVPADTLGVSFDGSAELERIDSTNR